MGGPPQVGSRSGAEPERGPSAPVPSSTAHPLDVALGDPLSETTRKERRSLLGISAAAIVVAKTGLLPTEISNLGIKFTPVDQLMLLRILMAVVVYFLLAFLVYAWTDFLRFRLAMLRLFRVTLYDDFVRGSWLGFLGPVAGGFRGLVEFIVPVAVGAYALWVLAHPAVDAHPKYP